MRPDLQKHFVISLIVAVAAGIGLMMLGIPFYPLIAVAISFSFGLAKELIWDKLLGKGHCDVYDIVADLLGCALGFLVLLLTLLK
jgi:O-antigen/teichoic acid export membrane protein